MRMAERSPFEAAAWQALQELETAIAAGRPPAPNPALRPALARLAELTQQIPDSADPQFRHYLQRGSFQKAREWLEAARDE